MACIVFFILLTLIGRINCSLVQATTKRETRNQLLDTLLSTHNKRIIPDGTQNETFKVLSDAGIIQIHDVDEKNQILDAFYYLFWSWYDEELAWNPIDHGNLTSLVLSEGSIWTPDVELVNNVDISLSKKSTITTYFQVLYTGQVIHNQVVNYKSSCSMNFRYFPFDKQNCTLTFIPLGYIGSDINLTIANTPLGRQMEYENSEFEFLGITALNLIDDCCKVSMPTLNYHVTFQRRPLFYVINMIMPCVLITLVAMLAFCIPPESGEKVGLGVTVLLSLTVFLLILSEQMPPMSKIPLVGVYYFGAVFLVTMSTALSIFTLNLHHRAEHEVNPVPRWSQQIFLKCLPCYLCMSPWKDNMEYSDQVQNRE